MKCQNTVFLIFAFTTCAYFQMIKKNEHPIDTAPGWCRAPHDQGYCSGENPVRKWRYSNVFHRCVPFNYTGCGGMYLNRFNNWFECAIYCEYHLSVT